MESAPAEHTPLTSGRVRVCIIGGGYGGRQAARKLPRAQFDVTLIDRKPYFEHIIGVYHCAVEPRNYARCRLDLARALPHVRLVIGEIASVDRTCTKMLNGTTIPFDYLVRCACPLNRALSSSGPVAGCLYILPQYSPFNFFS
eukprot:m.458400 g.458400  ORF g.458400 m.458400 type:complete len:143 (+) comp56990_c0_seq13:156-584(+)